MVQIKKKLIYVHKAEKLVKMYWLCRAEKDNHYQLCNLFFFFKPFKFHCWSFCL